MTSTPDVAVLSWASDHAQASALVSSCAHVSAPLTLHSPGGNDVDHRVFIAGILACPSPYVVLTDAYDVLCVRWNPHEIIALIAQQPSSILHSCESSCWPAGPWCDLAYPVPSRTSPWWAINGGQVAGKRDDLAAMIERVYTYPVEAGGGNQERIHRMIADGHKIGLDRDCLIFQSMLGKESEFVHRLECDGVLSAWNVLTNSQPMFLHFNGRAPGMEKWRGLLGC